MWIDLNVDEYRVTLLSSGVMVKVLYCFLEGSKFELQSHYYIPFQSNTFAKNSELPHTLAVK